MSSAIVRFAPSPTGYLHVGNARVALINWLLAKSLGGKFILRIDDTDQERSKAEYVDGIETDLTWLGLTWDEKFHQSDRFAQYETAAEKLKADGRLYACYETANELDLKRKLQRARGKPPVYDRAALSLSDEDKAKFEAEGRQPHWRFKLDHEDIEWTDLARGACKYNGANVSDPVLIRADGTFLYMLPSAVDDIEMGITHVVRGEDHVTNTAVQIQLYRALGAEPPEFAHLALMVGAEGQGLSKREGSLSLGEMREDGLEALAIDTLLAKIGTPDPVEVRETLQQLVEEFDIAKFGRASPRFDVRELEQLNAKVIHGMSFAAAKPRLDALGLDAMDEAFWDAIRPNLTKLTDAKDWWTVCRGAVTPVIEDAAFAETAAGLLPPEPWDENTWGAFANTVKAETGAKGKGLFMPLRQALTGMSHGPELNRLLPLIGRERAEARLKGQKA